LAKRRAPVNKTFPLEQTLRNKTQEVVIGALTVSPLPKRQLQFLPLPIFLVGSLGCYSRFVSHELLEGCREGAERFG
jgi:hypothetical protein